MPDWLMQGALPVGMLMFVGTVLAFARRRAGHHLAVRGYPQLAEELGLRYRASPYSRTIGKLTGEYDGYTVYVDPDDQRAIVVRFQTEPRAELRSYRHFTGAPHGLRFYRSGSKRFDALFKDRYVDTVVAERIDACDELDELVEPFRGRYHRQLAGLSVTSSGLKAVFDFGTPPYIPPAAVRELLPALTRLARLFEGPGAAGAVETASLPSVSAAGGVED